MKKIKLFILALGYLSSLSAFAISPPSCPAASQLSGVALNIVEEEGFQYVVSHSGYIYLGSPMPLPWKVAVGNIIASNPDYALKVATTYLQSISSSTTVKAFPVHLDDGLWWACRYPTYAAGLSIVISTPDSGTGLLSAKTLANMS